MCVTALLGLRMHTAGYCTDVTTLGSVSGTLGDDVICSLSGANGFSSVVDIAKVTCLGFSVPIATGPERMVSNCFNTSISSAPMLLEFFFNMPHKSLIALIIASGGVTTGCVK